MVRRRLCLLVWFVLMCFGRAMGSEVSSTDAQPHCLFVGNDGHILSRSEAGAYTPESVDQLYHDFRLSKKHSLVLFFHGGLVPLSTGVSETDALVQKLKGTDAYVIGVIWSSDAVTVVKNLNKDSSMFSNLMDAEGSLYLGDFVSSEDKLAAPDQNLSSSLGTYIKGWPWWLQHAISSKARPEYLSWATKAVADSKPSSLGPDGSDVRKLELRLAPTTSAIWSRMKDFISNACNGNDPLAIVPMLLAKVKSDPPSDTILIGHSAGAIYINRLLKEADAENALPTCDVVFEAPAITYHELAGGIGLYKKHVRNFRMYALRDTVERFDTVLNDAVNLHKYGTTGVLLSKYLAGTYPGSLLYYISNALEGPADVPLLGMERFFDGHTFVTPLESGDIQAVNDWSLFSSGIGWSDGGYTLDPRPGFSTAALGHGEFAFDAATLSSILITTNQWIAKAGS